MKKRAGIENFLKGFGSVINLFPEPLKLEDYNTAYSKEYSAEEQDAIALAKDWREIGEDINYALNKMKKELSI